MNVMNDVMYEDIRTDDLVSRKTTNSILTKLDPSGLVVLDNDVKYFSVNSLVLLVASLDSAWYSSL